MANENQSKKDFNEASEKRTPEEWRKLEQKMIERDARRAAGSTTRGWNGPDFNGS